MDVEIAVVIVMTAHSVTVSLVMPLIVIGIITATSSVTAADLRECDR